MYPGNKKSPRGKVCGANYLTNLYVQKNVIERQKLKLYTNLRSHDIFVKKYLLLRC